MMLSTQPLYIERLRIISMIGFGWRDSTYFTWLTNHKPALDSKHNHLPGTVLLSTLRSLKQNLPGFLRCGSSPLKIQWISLPFLVSRKVALDAHMMISAFARYLVKLGQILYLSAYAACSKWKMAICLILCKRFLSMNPIANLSRSCIATLFTKVVLAVLQSCDFPKGIKRQPLAAGIANQFSILVWSGPSSVPISRRVFIRHSSDYAAVNTAKSIGGCLARYI